MTHSAENGTPCPKHRALGVNPACPDCDHPAENDAGSGEPLTALDFVQMYLYQTEGHPQNGHYVNAVACRRKWPRKDDTRSRCTRCDGEALLATRPIPPAKDGAQ